MPRIIKLSGVEQDVNMTSNSNFPCTDSHQMTLTAMKYFICIIDFGYC